MPKRKTQYVCQHCGRVSSRELGRCPQCENWNTMLEVVVTSKTHNPSQGSPISGGDPSIPLRLADIAGDPTDRLPVAIGEFARVLGGGIVPGSVILIGGDPGIGKSTLMLQLATVMAKDHIPVLYVSGEESERQIKMRALRLAGEANPILDKLYLVTETNLDVIMSHIETTGAGLVIVDSIQTSHSSELNSSAGSVSQVRECAARFTSLAKATGIAVLLVGHVTKEGTIAGPRVLEHIVDTVLYLSGDRYHSYRLLRGVKNRFGPVSEVGVFQMGGKGMIEVSNPSEAFLAERFTNAPGSAIAITMEGTRPLLVEVQALASSTTFGNARRTPNGIDFNRLLLTTAVLTRRLGLRLADQDLFVNVVGGLQIQEPAADLAVAIAIASSVKNVPVANDVALVGEIGLSGELRSVGQLDARLREAAKLGFQRTIVPKIVHQSEPLPQGIIVKQVRSVQEAITAALVNQS